MYKKKVELFLVGIILTFGCFQYIYAPTYDKEGKIEEKNIFISSPKETLPSLDWERNYITADYDYSLALDTDSSENIYIAGYSGYYPDYSFLYVKYNKNGDLQNSLTWSANPGYNIGRDIIVDSSESIYISGYTDVDTSSNTNYNAHLTKISSLGAIQWQQTWGGSGYDQARAVGLDASENAYMAGLTYSYGGGLADAFMAKYSSTGTFQWYQTFGGIDSEWVNAMVYNSIDSFYLGGGFSKNGTTNDDFHLIKTNQDGVKQWDRTWGGAGGDIGISVALDSVGSVYILGYTESYGAVNTDACLIKYNSFGDLIWNITWGTENYEIGYSIAIDKFDDLYLGGSLYNYTDSKDYMFLVKMDNSGNQIWNMTRETSGDFGELRELTITNSGAIYTTGYEYFTDTLYDTYTRKFNYNLPDIKLIEPENKTYTEPMEGYYLNTYGFERDPNGGFPQDWIFETNGGGPVQVIQSLEDHNKVVEIHDTDPPDKHTGLTNHFTSKQTTGTVEFYFRTSDANKHTDIYLYEAGTDEGIRLVVMLNYLYYFKDNTYLGWGLPIANNTWYHFRIEFNSTTSTFLLWLNGVKIGGQTPYQNDNTGMNYISFTTWRYDENYYSYIDAIGYSWDPNYNIGDNLIEGLLIDYKMQPNIDWQAYSLDGQQNITTSGSIVIPFLEDGRHSIQISGNNTNGDLFQSEKRFFTVDTRYPSITINSPTEYSIFEGVPPIYNITVIEENIVSIWYTLDGGATNITITELSDFIDFDTWVATPEGPVTLEFYVKDILGNIAMDKLTITKDVTNPILIELVDLVCTENSFNFTFDIHNKHGIGIDSADIDLWWDGVDVSTEIQNLGNGLYFISLDPIFVSPGDDPVILAMTISASGYDDNYFETMVAIDPNSIQKNGDGRSSEAFPGEILIIIFSTLGGGALIGIISYYFISKRKSP